MKDTKIEWCDHSWSPWRGCTKVSPGCANCYAETLSKRNPAVLGQWGKGKPRVKAKNWKDPRRWNKASRGRLESWSTFRDALGTTDARMVKHGLEPFTRPTVFPSLCDWLDEEVPIEWLAEFLQLVYDTPNLTWLLLTKRPGNWPLVRMALPHVLASSDNASFTNRFTFWLQDWCGGHPPSNVWLGTSVEDQQRADERIPALLKIPARGRFLSLEPLLGPVDLSGWNNALPSAIHQTIGEALDWLIIGGESGPGSRPCNVEWIRSLVAQGKAAGVPTFVKQLGANACFDSGEGYLKAHPVTHPKGGDPAEWPEDLRVRQFPDWAPRS